MFLRLLLPLLVVSAAALAAPPVFAPGADNLRVKTCDTNLSGDKRVSGVVVAVSDDEVTILQDDFLRREDRAREVSYRPNDVLRAGKLIQGAYGRYTYQWKNMKVGDKVDLNVNTDHIDGEAYCTEVSIMRRPKGKLPECQKPKEYPEFAKVFIYNELENGEDVSDEAIAKVFKGEPARVDPDWPAIPPGLPPTAKKKLDAIRAKKAKEGEKPGDLKAPAPDKK